MRRTVVAAILTAGLTVGALAAGTTPATADPLGDLLSAGSSGGSSDFGSADSKKPQHYGKLGRSDAPNGVRSINTWVYAPGAKAISGTTYPKGSRIGVRWNSTIDAGPVVDGNECTMSIVLTGPKVPAKARVTKTQDCTATKTYVLRTPGSYRIRVTDGISGASNAVTFDIK